MKTCALVIGANGQIGTELTEALVALHGTAAVIAADLKPAGVAHACRFELLDVLDAHALADLIGRHHVTEIYHLAAVLSAAGERDPRRAWELNMGGLFNVLDAARDLKVERVFWPSSIAAFGPATPRESTDQLAVMDPNTVYGISKLAGERWCEYYFQKYGVDVRSLRYPGLISYKSPPGGGTTDYAVEIFHYARAKRRYQCFLAADARLPMMYMPDAIRATMELMAAPPEQIRIRSAYNVAAMSFTPAELAAEIARHVPDFSATYRPDFRQQIAASWPESIDDSVTRKDWGWNPRFDLEKMVDDMLAHLGAEQRSVPALS